MEIEKYRQAWEEFRGKMVVLKKRQLDVLTKIAQKLDQQKIDKIMKKIKR